MAYNRTPVIDSTTVASIHTVFARSRLSHQSWASRRFEGRLDSRQVWRNDARGSVDIFKDRRNPSPTKLNIFLLVDASGSMEDRGAIRNGQYVQVPGPAKEQHAQNLVATLVEAFKRTPTIRLHVWQHNASDGEASLYRVYEPGMDVAGLNKMPGNHAGGNADGFALDFIGRRGLKQARADEKTIVIVISDGLPSVRAKDATNKNIAEHTVEVAERLRSQGATILSVAIDGGTGENIPMYGEENVVPFFKDSPTAWSDFSRDLAALFGKALR